MMEETSCDVETTRLFAIRAACWLALIRFQVHLGAPVFGPGVTTYDDMLCPDTTDARRFAACATLLSAVRRHADQEAFVGESRWHQSRPLDPYGQAWRTTERGAVLEAIAELLKKSVATTKGAKT